MHRFIHKLKILPLIYQSVRLSGNKASKFHTPIQYLKPVRSQIRASKPLKSQRTYDTELIINKSLLRKFDNDQIDHEFEEDDEEIYQKLVHQPEEFYDQYKRDEKGHKELVKKKTIERKYFKKEKEPCLITWAAREQIYYLNSLNPTEWSPKHLSQSFPISEGAVKKIIKSMQVWGRYVTKEKKRHLDQVVANNWKLLSEGKLENVNPELLQLQLEGKLSSNLSMPNPNLPQTKPKPILIEKPVKPKGEFLSLVAPYLNSNADEPTNIVKNAPLHKEGRFVKTEDELREKYQYSRNYDMTAAQFHATFDKEFKFFQKGEEKEEIKEPISKVAKFYEAETDYIVEKYKKPIELTIDSENAYLYSSKTSYQHPIGKTEPDPDKIEIPKSKFKEGALYRVNNSFYSDDGEFLYKIIYDQ